jgi:proline iminopeptidase
LILAGPALDVKRWVADTGVMVDALDPETREVIRRAERDGTTQSAEYQEAMGVFYRRHVCRLDPWPDTVNHALETMNPHIYELMWGPSEFTCTGTLSTFDATPSLPSISVPTLVICGEHDEAHPDSGRYYASLIPGATFEVIESASHLANYDRPEAYFAAVRAFLRKEGL